MRRIINGIRMIAAEWFLFMSGVVSPDNLDGHRLLIHVSEYFKRPMK